MIYQGANDAVDTSYLSELGISQICIDHYPFPNVITKEDQVHVLVLKLRKLAQELGRSEFDATVNSQIAAFEPNRSPAQRCVLVHRNIFEHFVSIAMRYRKGVDGPDTINRQWPINYAPIHDIPKEDLAAIFCHMVESRVCECYAVHCWSFMIGHALYPNQVAFLPYEELVDERPLAKKPLLDFLNIDVPDVVQKNAQSAVSRQRMIEMEAKLGLPLAEASKRKSHIIGMPTGFYKKIVSPALARTIRNRLEDLQIAEIIWRAHDDDLLS